MSGSDLVHLLARAHPAVVHAPIGAALFLPLALGFAVRSPGRPVGGVMVGALPGFWPSWGSWEGWRPS